VHSGPSIFSLQPSVLKKVTATRYVTPLRQGGSMPAIVEADDDGMYVLKFRGAAQGVKVLIAELVAGEIARELDLPVPELVFIDLDIDLARTEPDPEISELIRKSGGLNIALDYLPGAVTFDPLVTKVDANLASKIVWFDAFVTNVDRTPRNTNMLMWHRKLHLIDHGAALYFHHAWEDDFLERATSQFAPIKDHVLLRAAARLEAADAECTAHLSEQFIRDLVASVPDIWFTEDPTFTEPGRNRDGYVQYLLRRLTSPHAFVEEAVRARSVLV
jgi:hypothetical protein